MTSLLVTPKNKKDFQLLKDLLDRMNVSALELNAEKKEDIGLSLMMQRIDRTRKVSRETIMKKLK